MNRISAKVVADSITIQGKRITTMEVVFPRFILAEFNTHRLFTRNSASSRAIPFKKMLKSVREQLFTPIAWQKDHSGMQGTEYFEGSRVKLNNFIWKAASKFAMGTAWVLNRFSVTKQLANRLLEPFMYHKVLITATEFENFFNLRCPMYEMSSNINNTDEKVQHFKSRKEYIKEWNTFFENDERYTSFISSRSDLDWLKTNKGQGEIHIMDLAEKMYDAMNESTPKLLQPGEWHIPYSDNIEGGYTYEYFIESSKEPIVSVDGHDSAWDNFKCMISVARCARLSYQTLGDNPKIDYKADIKLFNILKDSGHFSPFEHVARAMTPDEYYRSNKGMASIDTWSKSPMELYFNEQDRGWNNNFRGFVQYRWLLENNKI